MKTLLNPTVSVDIVTYNRLALVKKCLSQLKKHSPAGTEIVVVDNKSTENIVAFIKSRYPNIRLIENDNNLGFAKGNNLAMNNSRGDFYLLLNTDAFINSGVIEKMVEFLKKHPKVGVVGAQLRNNDGTIQPSGGFLPNLFQLFILMSFIDNLPIIRKFAPSL